MKRCAACFMVLISIVFLISVANSSGTGVQLTLRELQWSWEPLNIATFEGSIAFPGQTPDKVFLKLSFTVSPDDSETGEVVFQTVNNKKLTLRKQKPSCMLELEGSDSVSFTGCWKTPENVLFTRIEILCRVYNENESELLAEQSLVFSRTASDIARINDGRFRLNFDFASWTTYTAIAAAVIWLSAIARILKNKKRRVK